MIRFSRSSLRFVTLFTCQALAVVATAGRASEEAPPTATLTEATPPASAAEAPSPGKALPFPLPKQAATKPAIEYPAEIHGLLNLGASLTDRADYESAEIAFRQVMNRPEVSQSDLQSALLGLARMYRRQGALTKAAAIYEKFLKDFPGGDRSPDALLDLGRTQRAMGAYRMAISRFYSVINSTLKLPGEGFEHYQLLAKTAQFEIAETHFQAGDFAEASKFFARLRLLDLAPADRANAHFKSAYALQLQGDFEGAVTTLRSFLEQWPDNENVPEARYLLAVSLRALNRHQEAFSVTLDLLKAEKTQVEANPKRWIYWQRRTGNQLANDFFESGETINAESIYESLVVLSNEPTWRLPITYQIALCQERLGHTDLARISYKSIIESAGKSPAPELAEVIKMAGWRIDHLDWRDHIGHQVTAFFETTTGHPASDPVPAPATPKSAALQ